MSCDCCRRSWCPPGAFPARKRREQHTPRPGRGGDPLRAGRNLDALEIAAVKENLQDGPIGELSGPTQLAHPMRHLTSETHISHMRKSSLSGGEIPSDAGRREPDRPASDPKGERQSLRVSVEPRRAHIAIGKPADLAETSADVLIVDAGASGAALAWSLAETRMDIVCLQQGDWMNPAELCGMADRWPCFR